MRTRARLSPGRPFRAAAWLALLALAACSGGSAPTPSPSPSGELGEDLFPEIDGETPLPDPLPAVAAVVNGHEIPTRNVILMAENRIRRGEVELSRRVYAYRHALQEVIARELLFQDATSKGLEPDPKGLEQAYDDARAGRRDDDAWAQYLAEQGMDEETFRKELRIQHTVNALVTELVRSGDFEVSDAEAKAFYDANPERFQTGERLRASQIQLRVPEGADPEQVELELHSIRERILEDGEDFAELAKEHSQDAGSAARGGRLQIFARGQVPEAFEEVAFGLEVGEVSEVFQTEHGFHIVKLEERLPSEPQEFGVIRELLKQRLQQMKRQRRVQEHVAALRKRARIETFL